MAISLYDRLGGVAGITAIASDVVENHLNNPVVAPRFRASADIPRVKRLAAEFFCAGAGGPEAYSGKDMRSAHRGMNINEQEYLAVIDDVMAALAKHKIDDTTSKDVLAILYSLKGEVLHL
jgi:hemoglobin